MRAHTSRSRILGPTTPQTITKAELPPDVQKKTLGDASTQFTLLTDQQMIDAAKRENQCQITESGLTKCLADVDDWKAKFDASQKDVETWKTAAKGGNWLHRTMRIAVPLACAGGGAWLGSRAKSGGKGAAIGAMVGGGGCALSFRF